VSLVFIPSYLKSLTIFRPSIIVADIMETILFAIFACILWLSRDRNLLIENLALRQQLAILKQKNKRPKIRLRYRIELTQHPQGPDITHATFISHLQGNTHR
jgi:hypothetical protein